MNETQRPTETCGEHFVNHPTWPHLVAVCTLAPGHAGDHDNLQAGEAIERAEAERDAARETSREFFSEAARHKRRANAAVAALADLRARIEALADSYRQYETDVWGEDVAHNLRAALLAEEA